MLMLPISSSLRSKRSHTPGQPKPASLKHSGQHRIIQQQQFPIVDLQGDMAVPEVISRLQQRQR